jgi:hypothetical protein
MFITREQNRECRGVNHLAQRSAMLKATNPATRSSTVDTGPGEGAAAFFDVTAKKPEVSMKQYVWRDKLTAKKEEGFCPWKLFCWRLFSFSSTAPHALGIAASSRRRCEDYRQGGQPDVHHACAD